MARGRAWKPKVIASEQNDTFKSLLKLLSSRGIQDQGQALIAGDKIIPEVAAHHPAAVRAWITPEGWEAPPLDVAWICLAPKLFEALNQFGTHSPLLVVGVPEMPLWSDNSQWPPGCSLFLALQNPDNLGAIVRSGVAFGVRRFVLLKEAAHPFHPKSMRAAGTGLLKATFERGPSIRELNVTGAPLFVLDAGGMPLEKMSFPERFALLPGVEGPGVPGHLALGQRISISMQPGVESLNATIATAIALYEWRRSMP
ncbi:MAG: TrmH family RNA methyltransferase [Deltaproteobacteria bacterium]|nr:TrmH family RNA methyltransferase [Deltaproteobacteria bacterium]